MSSALADFKTVIQTLHELLHVIDKEVTETIDSRDPNTVSATLAPRASAELLDAYKAFTKYSDKLASFAADPSDVGVTLIGGFHETNAIQVASELGVADALGYEELPLSDIARRVGADEYRLRQVMRLLANRSVFRETYYGSDVFANNRLSSVFFSAHERNLRGIVGHWADDAYKAGVHIVDGVKLASENKCPFELEHGMTIWEWFKTPESALARDRTNKAMVGAEGFLHGALIYDYDWDKHGQEATIVDVGGGVGGASIELCRRFPKIKIVLQDRSSVIEAAPKFWEENAPECKPRVTFMPHDFFGPQIHEKIFFMRFIIHDWVDEDCLRLLKPIRDVIPSEAEGGRLYIADSVLDEKSERLKYMLDLQMLTFTGAMERTEVEFNSLLKRAGFRILKIHKNRGFCALIEAVAA